MAAEIPEGTKKCCSGCFTKINRKIGQALSDPEAAKAAAEAAKAAEAKATQENHKAKDQKDTKEGIKKEPESSKETNSKDGAKDGKDSSVKWSEDEIEGFKAALRAHEKNWASIAEAMANDPKVNSKANAGQKKTAEQCKSFFFTHRKKQQLDKILIEVKRVRYLLTSLFGIIFSGKVV